MKPYAHGIESTDLRLVEVQADPIAPEEVPTNAPTTGTLSSRTSSATSLDRYIEKASKEYSAGHIDRTLWARAVAHGGGDDARTRSIYVQSRATALRVTKREERAARYAGVVKALSDAPDTGIDLGAPGSRVEAKAPGGSVPASAKVKRKRLILAGAALGSFMVVCALIVALWDRGPDPQPKAAPSTRGGSASGGAATTSRAAAASHAADAAPASSPEGEDFVYRMQALQKDGNWHLVVLYGVEWARKQPENPVAWRTLSLGYIKLRQYAEALESATKAAQLAPEDFLPWQNLGQIYVVLERPADALAAFEHALALNDRDTVSLVQQGLLQTQLGRLPEARATFAKALAVSPEDVQALCGAAASARKDGRVKDAEALMQQVTSLADRCVEPTVGQSVRVVPAPAARARTGS